MVEFLPAAVVAAVLVAGCTASPSLNVSSQNVSSLPHIVLIVIDDLGSNDLGFRGQQIRTPHVDQLRADGVLIESMYTMPVCSPSRSALITGRYAPRLGLQHQVIWSGAPAGLFLNETTVAEHLKASGYASHGTGKWHNGFFSWDHTPTFRGFDSFLGFFGGGEDYFTHVEGSGSESPGPKLGSGFDMWFQGRPRCAEGCALDLANNHSKSRGSKTPPGVNGQYSTELFGSRAVQVIEEHEPSVRPEQRSPLFLYVAFQAVHGPLQSPQRYVDANSHIENLKRRTFAGMLTAADEAIGNITGALRARGMYDRTLIIVTTDNGGDTSQGGGHCPPLSYCGGMGSNYPLRGGKHTVYEGGVRGVAVVSGGHLPTSVRGSAFGGIMHVTDIYPTLLGAAGVPEDLVPHFAFDGIDHWPVLSGGSGGGRGHNPRTEVLIQLDPLGIAFGGQQGDGPKAVLRHENYKLIIGPPGCPDAIFTADNMTGGTRNCSRLPPSTTLLFDVVEDPGETTNLATNLTHVVDQLRARIAQYNRSLGVPPFYPDNDPEADPKLHGGSWTPWQ